MFGWFGLNVAVGKMSLREITRHYSIINHCKLTYQPTADQQTHIKNDALRVSAVFHKVIQDNDLL